MCKYCSKDEDVDTLEKSFINGSVDVGLLGELSANGKVDAKNSKIEFSIITDTGEARIFNKAIKYCPFCGRVMDVTEDSLS